ncbi:unnamed protein product, partial [Polarella glacialis]
AEQDSSLNRAFTEHLKEEQSLFMAQFVDNPPLAGWTCREPEAPSLPGPALGGSIRSLPPLESSPRRTPPDRSGISSAASRRRTSSGGGSMTAR